MESQNTLITSWCFYIYVYMRVLLALPSFMSDRKARVKVHQAGRHFYGKLYKSVTKRTVDVLTSLL